MAIMREKENQSVLLAFVKGKKKLFCLMLFSMCFFNGCISPKKVYPNTTCNVCSVEKMSGSHKYVCKNATDIYLYDKNGIYRYNDGDMELLVITDNVVEYMACNSYVLYYVCSDELYRVNLKTKVNQNMEESGDVIGMSSCNEDIFITVESVPFQDNIENDHIYMYHEAEDGIVLNNILDEKITQNEKYMTMQYGIYQIGGYREDDYTRIILVRSKDDWNYSYDYNSLVSLDLNNKLLQIDNMEYMYDNQIYQMESVKTVDDTGARTTASHCAVQGENVYMLYQYGEKYQAHGENPDSHYKSQDALFQLNPIEQSCELIYETKDRRTQIAGFSLEKQKLYLLENDGIYGCRFDGTEKKKLLENQYKELSFEYCNGKLFVFEHPSTWKVEFLAALD